jgi:hypothetical protein
MRQRNDVVNRSSKMTTALTSRPRDLIRTENAEFQVERKTAVTRCPEIRSARTPNDDKITQMQRVAGSVDAAACDRR